MRILIVDDEESTRFYLKKLILKKFGFKISEAANGIEALESIQETRPDIVFLDISMPQMDGIECLREIRRDRKTDSLPVVVMTAHNDAETVNEFVQLGIYAYILKPFGYYQTFEKLKEILSGLKKEEDKEPSVEDELYSGLQKQKVVVADSDPNFRTFFRQLFHHQYRIAEAKDEEECKKAALNTNPDLVIISDNLNCSDEVKLITSLRGSSSGTNLKIFLCRDVNESFNSSNENYDGVLKKSFLNEYFVREFATKVLGYQTLFGYIQDILTTYIKFDVIGAVKHSLQLKNGHAIQILDEANISNINDHVLSKSELVAINDDFVMNIGIVGTEKESLNFVKILKDPPSKLVKSNHTYLNYLCYTVASQIRLAIEKFGINTEIDFPKIKNIFLNTFYSYWKIIIPVKVENNCSFIIGVNLEKKN